MIFSRASYRNTLTGVAAGSRGRPFLRFIALLCPVALLAGGLFFFRLGARDLWGSHEARAAQNSQRMLDDGAWVLPRLFDDHLDLQKPPLYYWLVAVITRVAGGRVNAWTERLPAALSACAGALAIFLLLHRRGRPIAGMLAAAVLVTAQHYTWLARTGRIDMPLTLSVTAAILALAMTRRWQFLGALALAAGLLLKGPVGAVIPIAVLGADFLVERRLNKANSVPPRVWIWVIPVAVALAAPWFVLANIRTNGEFARVFFWHHNVERAMGSAADLAVHPWWHYGPRLGVDAMPWSLALVPAVASFVRSGQWRVDREARLGLTWLVVVTVVLSCARFKRADYLLPAYPGLALFLGCTLERWWEQAKPGLRRALMATAGLGFVGIAGAWGYLLLVDLPRHEAEREQASFARVIRGHAPAPQVVLFFRVESHALAFHLGRPVNTFLEWENLDVWAGRPGPHYVVMPLDCAEEWQNHVTSGALERIVSNVDLAGGFHDKPLVLMRTCPNVEAANGSSRSQTLDWRGTVERGNPGAQRGEPAGGGADAVAPLPGDAWTAVRNPPRR